MKIGAIVSAAGASRRMGTEKSKLYLDIQGKMVLARTLETIFAIEDLSEVVIVIRPEDEHFAKACIPKDTTLPWRFTAGGDSREASTANGLAALSDDLDGIITHDGARPFAPLGAFEACIQALKQGRNAITVVPCKDTMKFVDPDGKVSGTPDRSSLFAVQTPQAFLAKDLRTAYDYWKQASPPVTDDAGLVEAIGKKVYTVQGDYGNIKITTKEDLTYGERLIQARASNWNGL